MKKYEYLLIPQPERPNRTTSISDFLDGLGLDGWELCAIDYGCFIFKRVLEET